MPHTNDPTRHYVPLIRPDGSSRSPQEALTIARVFAGHKVKLVIAEPKIYDQAIGLEYLVSSADGSEVFPAR